MGYSDQPPPTHTPDTKKKQILEIQESAAATTVKSDRTKTEKKRETESGEEINDQTDLSNSDVLIAVIVVEVRGKRRSKEIMPSS